MPRPDGPEAVHKRDVLPQVRVQPQARRDGEVRDAEQDDAEDGHEEEQAQQAQEPPAEVVHAEAQLERPQRVQHDGEDDEQRERRVHLAHHLRPLVQPRVVHVVARVLLRLHLDRPQPLDALRLLAVAVRRVGVDLVDAERQHRHGEQLERVLERRAVRDLRQQRVLLARLFVRGGLEGAEGSLDCGGLSATSRQLGDAPALGTHP